MRLPVLEYPLFDAVIPSTKRKIQIRPMRVREEKILLIAKESGAPSDIFKAIKSIVSACMVDADAPKVDTLTLFDLEYLFLRIRAISVSNVVKVTYQDAEDKKDYNFEVDLDKVQVKFPEKQSMTIETGEAEGFTMRYPTTAIYNSEVFQKPEINSTELVEELVIGCLENYFKGEAVYNFKDNSKAEVKTFLEDLDIVTFNKIRDFVSDLPTISYDIKYTNLLGNEKTISLTTLSDFFTLR